MALSNKKLAQKRNKANARKKARNKTNFEKFFVRHYHSKIASSRYH